MMRGALSLGLLLLALLILPPTPMDSSQLLAFSVLAAFAAIALSTRSGPRQLLLPQGYGRSSGPPAEERRLHGTFRRHTSPTAPGRPQPRAPGLLK